MHKRDDAWLLSCSSIIWMRYVTWSLNSGHRMRCILSLCLALSTCERQSSMHVSDVAVGMNGQRTRSRSYDSTLRVRWYTGNEASSSRWCFVHLFGTPLFSYHCALTIAPNLQHVIQMLKVYINLEFWACVAQDSTTGPVASFLFAS